MSAATAIAGFKSNARAMRPRGMRRAPEANVPRRRTPWRLLAALLAAGCNPAFQPDRAQPAPTAPAFDVRIREPEKLTSIEASAPAENAKNLRVPCVTCHSLRDPAPVPRSAGALKEFHTGLNFRHGELACASCHAEGQPPHFRLADGTTIATRDAIRLCAQCHGPQFRDYQHGAHGGMRGYWDRSRGPREPNHCVDCHDPHAPHFVGGLPVPR